MDNKVNFRNVLYYITPIGNVGSIMQHGLLSNEAVSAMPHTTVAMQVIQERRNSVRIPHGQWLHQYVNLYFDARNPMMYRRKGQVNGLCVLIIKSDVLNLAGVVIADRNASSDYTSFMSSQDGLQKVDFDTVYCEDWTDTDKHTYFYKKSTKCAEVLVPHKVTSDYIEGAYVGNQVAKDFLLQQGFLLTISMNPRMFFLE